MRLRSIEQKIFLWILPICLVPPVIFLILLGVGSRLTFENTVGADLRYRVNSLTDQFDQFLFRRMSETRGLLTRHGQDPASLAAEPAAAPAALTAVVWIAPGRPPAVYPLREPALSEPLQTALAMSGGGLSSEALLPTAGLFTDLILPAVAPSLAGPGRASSQFLVFSYPAPNRTGYFRLLFQADRLVEDFRQSLSQVIDNFYIYSTSGYLINPAPDTDTALAARMREMLAAPDSTLHWFAIKNRERTVLVAATASQTMSRLSVQAQADTPETKNPAQIAGTGAASGAVWHLLLQYDMENFLGPLDTLTWLAIVITLLLVLLLLVLAWLGARRITRPLASLRRQAEALASGNLDVRARVGVGDEIGQLAEAFNVMASRLRTSYRALEERLEENELRARHINVINEITAAIIQVLSLDSIFDILHRELLKIIPYDAIWMTLFEGDEERDGDPRVTHIMPPHLLSLFDRGHIPLAGSLHGRVIELRETMHAELGPQHQSHLFEASICHAEGLQSFLIAPLPARHRIIGTLTVASVAPDACSPRMAPIMTSLAGAVAIAIEQASLFQRISQFATNLEQKVADRNRELEMAQQNLIQAEKYIATGRMAGNLAHEINNPLGIIKNYLQLVKNNLSQAGETDPHAGLDREHIQVIDEEVDRIARLVRQMLSLHRPVEHIVQPVDVNEIIEDILRLMEEDLRRGRIEVSRELAVSLPRPVASPDLIRQVLINLIRNAQDAMEEGGRLTLRTSVVTDWQDGAEHQELRIRVTDTGRGIAPEHRSQIFDPFFTTKPPDKGTGLGLCVSYSIVSMYQGAIDVESEPGRGTSMIVSLPLDSHAAPPVEEAPMETTPGSTDLADGHPNDLQSALRNPQSAIQKG